MKAIVAVNNKGYIGLDNGLIWKSKSDLEHFKNITNNSTLLVGYNTSLKLPNLKNRKVIIDERDKLFVDVDWCIGGNKTYLKYMKHFTEIHVSYIDDDSEGDVKLFDLSLLPDNCKVFNYYFKTDV